FGQPALGGQLVTAGSADFNITQACVLSGHGVLLIQRSVAWHRQTRMYMYAYTNLYVQVNASEGPKSDLADAENF
ncbi:hypothetical protein, partial [Pseudomonas sp. YuFO8]|uniref:hypothetical protein n=1 Tax=Pseudomonas sp. YuFO8 TaxID=3095361 RepID=UPI002B240416